MVYTEQAEVTADRIAEILGRPLIEVERWTRDELEMLLTPVEMQTLCRGLNFTLDQLTALYISWACK